MNRLKKLRKGKKLTQVEFSKEIKIPYRTIQRWENGETSIRSKNAKMLAEYFGVSVGYLPGYEPEGMLKRSIYDEVYSALLRVKSENPNHDDRVAIREVCMELIEATLEGY
ncbi:MULTISPECIES: helix-turn-helix transcriptional regulator [unclassified Streptococcus]|uniref:helix-turn-helix domain-containing protein n=1 Tax=unclassified Streptococcus TaxID=2608887 RepID=UPI001565CBFD|nr:MULTISPECIES: helix-turn-helix transcriptional regulator [unclassified Streptococcus]